MQVLWCASAHGNSDSPAHHLAGRQYFEGGDRLRNADPPVPLRQLEGFRWSGDVAGRFERYLGVRGRSRRSRPRGRTGSQIRKLKSIYFARPPWVLSKERNSLRRERSYDGVLGLV